MSRRKLLACIGAMAFAGAIALVVVLPSRLQVEGRFVRWERPGVARVSVTNQGNGGILLMLESGDTISGDIDSNAPSLILMPWVTNLASHQAAELLAVGREDYELTFHQIEPGSRFPFLATLRYRLGFYSDRSFVVSLPTNAPANSPHPDQAGR